MQRTTETIDKVRRKFKAQFDSPKSSIIVRSPGRINLIGEHTDYNEGFVLPSAIDRAIYMQIAPRNDTQVNICSIDFDAVYSFTLDPRFSKGPRWANYLIGVVDQLARRGYKIQGFDCAYSGDIPIGAGMSSSAAVEAGLAFGLNELNGWEISRQELAKVAQRAENEFVGVSCGIMDQFANLLSERGSALHLDCRSLEFEYIPFEGNNLSFVLCDTGVKHELASSKYNMRRRECEAGVEAIRKHFPSVRSLRDVTTEMLQAHAGELDPVVYGRCKYVLEENDRVDKTCGYLRRGDFERFGELLYKSHNGLRDLYQVSCAELDTLVEAASGSSGVLGARMMGGGFGGCTLNLITKEGVGEFSQRVSRAYSAKTGNMPKLYECSLTGGTELLSREESGD